MAVDEFGREIQIARDFLERIDGADAGMAEGRGRPRLAPQPLAVRGVAQQVRRHRLERHGAAKPLVAREVDAAHSASANLALNRVRADVRARTQLAFEQVRNSLGCRALQKLAGPRVVSEQRSHLLAHRGIVCRLPRDPGPGVRRCEVDHGFKQVANPSLLIGGHGIMLSAAGFPLDTSPNATTKTRNHEDDTKKTCL